MPIYCRGCVQARIPYRFLDGHDADRVSDVVLLLGVVVEMPPTRLKLAVERERFHLAHAEAFLNLERERWVRLIPRVQE